MNLKPQALVRNAYFGGYAIWPIFLASYSFSKIFQIIDPLHNYSPLQQLSTSMVVYPFIFIMTKM